MGTQEVIAGKAPDRSSDPDAAKHVEGRQDEPPPRGRAIAVNLLERYALILAWAVVVLVFTVVPETAQTFPTSTTASTILGSQTVIVFVTLALLIPITAGDFDLSVASTLSLSAMIIAVLNVQQHWSLGAAIAVALMAGILIGGFNGLIVIKVGIDPLIVTLGTMTVVQGLVYWISDSNTFSGVAPQLVDWVLVKRILGVPIQFYYGLALAAILWYVLDFTPTGRRLAVVGRGRRVARLSGIAVPRYRFLALVSSGFVAALAGAIYVGTTGSADPVSGGTFLLPAFAAAFLGATAIQPGRFNPWGSIIAVYFLVTGITGLQLLGIATFVQYLFYGGFLLIAVVLSQLARGRVGFMLGGGDQ
jgi:ribose transport system permease protein